MGKVIRGLEGPGLCLVAYMHGRWVFNMRGWGEYHLRGWRPWFLPLVR